MPQDAIFGQQFTTMGPEPAGQIGRPKDSKAKARHDTFFDSEDGETDKRVKWARDAEAELVRFRDPVTQMVKRNWRFYRGEHWDLSERPKWKIASKLNYVYWAVEYWTALLTDSRPKCVFSPYDRKDANLASIMSAAWNEWYETEDAQYVFEQAALLSQIEMVSYIYWYYEPRGINNRGVIRARNVSVENLFMDKLASSIDDANIVLYRYPDTRGSILARFPKLAKKLRAQAEDATETSSMYDMRAGSMRPQPGTTTTPTTNQSIYTTGSGPTNVGKPTIQSPQYRAHSSPPSDWLKDEIVVKEFWLRHKGPDYDVEVEELVWTAGNEIATIPRLIKKNDGTMEVLQTVVTGRGLIYELPMSIAALLKFQSDTGIGLKILSVNDSLEAVTQKVMVPKYPNGRRLIVVGDYVADDGANPYAHGRIPLAELAANPNPKDPIGTCTVNQIIDPQEYLNRLYSLILDSALLTANPRLRLPISEDIDDDELTNAPGSIVRETALSLKLGRYEAGPELPQYVIGALNLTIGQIKEISGITENATGGKAKGQIAAETVSMMQEQAGVRFRKASRSIERAIRRSGELFKGLVAQFYRETRLVRIQDAATGKDKPVQFVGTKITAPMRLLVKTGSMLPQSPSTRMNYLMQSLQTPWGNITDVLRGIEEFGYIDSALETEQRLDEAVTDFMVSSASGQPDIRKIIKWPGLMQMLMGGGGKKKPPQKDGGRSVRNRTPAQAA